MKFIVKITLSNGEVEYYLDIGLGTTPNRYEATVFNLKDIRGDKRIAPSWYSKSNVRLIPVGGLKAYEHI